MDDTKLEIVNWYVSLDENLTVVYKWLEDWVPKAG